ncbi:MAG: FAD-binding oxidoreductase [Flavobacteriia bacterium]|nr:FAD-binding oxidoreductase [Flavobacteriia bacterium]
MQSYWETSTYSAPSDLLIIGSGLTGLLCAYHYAQRFPTRKVRILERGPFPFGASTRNAGFACFGSPTELLDDLRELGENDTLKRVEMRVKGLEFYRSTFNPDDYDFNKRGGWEIFRLSESHIVENAKDRLDYLNQLLTPILNERVYDVDKDINRFGAEIYPEGFHNPHEGQLHPGKLCRLIDKAIRQLGVEIVNGIEIETIENTSDEVILLDKSGFAWKAAQCIVATNGLTKSLFPDENIEPARGQILMTSPIPELKWKGTFHIDRGYFYFRNVENRLLLGGGRHLDVLGERSSERVTSEKIQTELEQLLKTLLPKANYKVDMRWSGIMAFGAKNEKAPRVEALSDNLVLAARLGGMGVAIAPEVSKQAVNLFS